MKKEIAELWIAELRSGKYKQGSGALKQINNKGDVEHCCLGVLCEMYIQENGEAKGRWLTEPGISALVFTTYSDDDSRCILNSKMKEWSGIFSCIGECSKTKLALTELNDGGKTFEEIANIIEAHMEDL